MCFLARIGWGRRTPVIQAYIRGKAAPIGLLLERKKSLEYFGHRSVFNQFWVRDQRYRDQDQTQK